MKNFTHFFRVLTLCLVTLVSSGAWATVQTYQKVTSAPTDWSGEYLIVYEAGNCAMNGSLTALDVVSNTQAVTIKDNAISLDDYYSFTIAPMDGGYSIQANSGKYIGNASNSNGLTLSDNALANTLSLTANGDVQIVSSGGAYLRYNATSGQTRFRYYKSSSYSNQKAIHLYKKASTTPPTDVLKSLTVSGAPTKTTYEAGEEFDPAGLTVTGTYSESGNKTVTNGITWTITPETLTVGTTSVSVVAKVGDVESSSYTVNGVTVIAPKTLTSIAISGTPTKMEYQVGDAFNPAGLVVTGKYSDYSQEEITEGIDWIITPATFAEADVAASVSVVAKVGDIESSPYMATGLIVKEKTTPSALVVDFENALDTYTDWVFTNAEQGTTTITAHGGTYYGTTGGKTTASIQTKDIIAAPQSFTCYISKQSTNTAACTWSIQVSSDGDNWTDVATTDAKAMNKGVWVEFSADLSSYANVYVRVYYSGTAAVRTIDDITLTMGKASSDPSISASNVDIAADATSGEIAYTINNPVAGKTLTATTDADWITITQVTDEKVTFTTTANTEATERSADITLKYEGATDKVVAVTQKAAAAILTTIDQIFAKATEAGSTATEVSIKFDGWYVTGVKGSNAYATDGTKGFIIYGSGHGFVVGDALNGTVTCKVQLYNGSAELTQLTTSTEGLTVTPNHSISAVEKTIDQLSGINTGAVVTIKNVTYDGANFTDGTNVIVPFNSLMTLPTFEENGKYNITGVYLQFNTSAGEKKEILPRSEADIESLATTKYTITWSVNGTTTDEEVNEGAAIDFTPATVPAGYTADYVFRGWTTESTVDAEPTYVTEATATANVTYYAVFARKTTTGGAASLTKLDGTSTLADGDKLAIFAHVGDNYYGMKHETISTSYVNYYVLDEEPTYEAVTENDLNWWTLNQEEENWTLGDEENGYLVNSDNNLYADKDTGSYLTIAWDSENSAYTIKNGTRWIGCRSDLSGANQYKFRGAGNSTSPTSKSSCYLDIYRISTGTVTYSDFCTILPAGFELTIHETGYATFYDEVDRLIPNGVTAYYCEENASGSLKPVEITTGVIPAETGVILEGKAATYMLVEGDGTAEEIEGNCLMGVMVEYGTQDMIDALEFIYGAAPTIFVFSKKDDVLGFYKYVGSTLGAHKAFYATVSEAGINGFTLDFGGQAVGVGSVIRAANLKAGYDIQGRRINQMQKGINILNGKKIIK